MSSELNPNPLEPFETEFHEILIKVFEKLDIARAITLEQPPEGKGDYAFPCFQLAPLLKKSPNEIANDIVQIIGSIVDDKVSGRFAAEGGYVNFIIDPQKLVANTVTTILGLQDNYGQLAPKGIRIILEHTSANPTDKLHVGRARNPIIGDSLARILRCAGYDVETQYYVDDMGKQAARKILETRYPDWDRTKFKTGYQWATTVTTADSEHYDEDKVQELNNIMEGLEQGEVDMLKEAEKVCDNTMNELIIPSLDKINIKIDKYVNESQFMQDDSVNGVMTNLKNSEYFGTEDGAYYIDLQPFELKMEKDKFYFTRSDGKSLYATRDIAYHQWKFKNCDIAINILGEDHKLEAEYVRIGLKITGVEKAPESIFYAFVNLPEGKMSTRKGQVVYLDELVDEATELAEAEVRKRRDDLADENVKNIAELVATGAVRYNIIRIQAEKMMIFKWDEALNFEGDSAPFIQYAHARACSILRKSEGYTVEGSNLTSLENEVELALCKSLAKFPNIVEDCAEGRKAHPLASYAHELAAMFNQFYRDCPVLTAEPPELRAERLALVDCTKHTLNKALELLGIAAPEAM
jgi:arginyl-tRNA synthetase